MESGRLGVTNPAVDGSGATGAPHVLRVEPTAIPAMRTSIAQSLDKLGKQIEHAFNDLRIRPWAGDPVSDETAGSFNEHSMDPGAGAIAALSGYRDQLQAAADALRSAESQYRMVEGDNAAIWGKGC
ncbi:hypothetical protein D5S17_28695 [Pseudonocardiaceae bacterium YIM PH 21723]|nr:hypothetical protein D5S17_28695 [Pseudonocardiaceae bacterium YIM PH 21723]